MKGMKTSILHAFHVLHGLKIKLASIAPGPLFSATQKKYGNFIRLSCAVPCNDRLERALKKLGGMVGELMEGLNN